ncbi:MAG: hypothetical protein HYV60_23435 [Planctomycetia bacterium]|nr:hypothetical protein [Planctomycetia bacterium]
MPEIRYRVTECAYAWNAAYLLASNIATVRIKLTPEVPIAPATLTQLKEQWRNGILAKWDSKFPCHAPLANLRFDVQWVESGEHHAVTIHPGPSRSNMLNWDDADDGHAASHEFGHMLGMKDEYPDATCTTRSPVSTGSVMDTNSGLVTNLHVQKVCAGVPLEPPMKESVFDFAQLTDVVINSPMKVVMRITGGHSAQRIIVNSELDEATATCTSEVNDKLHGIISSESKGNIAAATFASIRNAITRMRDERPARVDILPDSVVGVLDVEMADKVLRLVYPIEESRLPFETPAQASGLLNSFVSVSPSNSVREVHSIMTTEASTTSAKGDGCNCPPSENLGVSSDVSHLSPDQHKLYTQIVESQQTAPQESATVVTLPQEGQSHRIELGTHNLPNEARGCWRHGVDTRSSRIKVWVEISHPTLFDFLNQAIDCAVGCGGASLVFAIATGVGAAAAGAAFVACFKACLAAQVGWAIANDVEVRLDSHTEHGDWSGH